MDLRVTIFIDSNLLPSSGTEESAGLGSAVS